MLVRHAGSLDVAGQRLDTRNISNLRISVVLRSSCLSPIQGHVEQAKPLLLAVGDTVYQRPPNVPQEAAQFFGLDLEDAPSRWARGPRTTLAEYLMR